MVTAALLGRDTCVVDALGLGVEGAGATLPLFCSRFFNDAAAAPAVDVDTEECDAIPLNRGSWLLSAVDIAGGREDVGAIFMLAAVE
jgi:hypothetical protein